MRLKEEKNRVLLDENEKSSRRTRESEYARRIDAAISLTLEDITAVFDDDRKAKGSVRTKAKKSEAA